ncbi:ABC transporter, ATP binding protein [Acidilobus saccharovorans 345-15]|uniref:ABC transporter, ATP binding protein n=1 Tax=Acidilobus saccharovorans (strain DSM 16705 / JCM 18335 / VKM B-2471 / 345-15) TaxID=666510 RepID=D9Q0P5_ACIS3|nr:ABC transporter ATP-binding protein [Acidilobus saccharovorans]ADL18883.1 ABC transporter, ATP binding protein [Acidilobus saccharovorans 345-15]
MGLSIRGLVKSFGKHRVLNGIDLDVHDGELFVILGYSGSGKTTLLRCIAGLEKVDSGKIYIDNIDVTNLPPGRRSVSMLFQNYVLYPHKTVLENIMMPIEGEPDARKRAIDMAEELGIRDLLDRYPSQLSGGQQQRVALARALVRRPRVLLLDEPLSNIDAPQRISARRFIKDLQRREKITTIYVTHDQIEAMAEADRMAIMMEGRILQVGTPEELYYDPANKYVAAFVGDPPMAIIDGSVLGLKGTIGVRADDVIIGQGPYEGVVDAVEFIMGRYLVHIELGDYEVRGYSNQRLKEGEKVRFNILKFKTFEE